MRIPQQSQWVLVLFMAFLISAVAGDFISDANALIKNHKTVRLDPLLRRALLKALTELEEEAQIKADEEERAARAAANDKLQEAVETADPGQFSTPLDEIQTTADTSYPTPSPAQETVAPTTEAVPTTAPLLEETTSQPLQTEAQTNPTATIQDTFFFHTPAPLDGHSADLTKAVSLPDIESNLITEDGSTLHQSIGALRSREELSSPPTQQTPTSPLPAKQVQAPDNDVEIFKAPLAAAFTLHQDDRGTPKGVVPLFRPQPNSNQAPTSNQFFQSAFQRPQFTQFQRFPQFPPLQNPQQNVLIQQSQNTNSFTLSPSQQLARLQQAPDQFLNQFPPQGFQQPQPFQQQQEQFQPSSGPFGFAQALSGHQQLPSVQDPLIFNQQSQRLTSVTVTPNGDRLNNGVSIPSSTLVPPLLSNSITQQVFPVSTTLNPPAFQSSTARPITFQSSTPQTTFTIPPVTLPLQNEPRFQSPIIVQQPSKETQQFLEDQHVRQQRLLAEENRLRQLEGQAHFRLQQVTRERQNEEIRIRNERLRARPADFQRSLSFTLTPDPFQQQFQTNNRVNRQEPFASTGNFGFNPAYRTLPDEVYRPRPFRSPQQELAQFLYQSGVATHSTGQEDLNIVSKVLALNHQRSDQGVNDAQRTTQAQSGFRPSSFSRRSDDIPQSGRRKEDKTLLVGEIKEMGAR